MARLVLFEDNHTARTLLELQAKRCGHEIAAEGHDLPASLALIGRIAAGELKPPDAWVIDADLGGGSSDGTTIVKRLEELRLSGLRIGFSADPWPSESGVDVDTGKSLPVLMAALGKLAV